MIFIKMLQLHSIHILVCYPLTKAKSTIKKKKKKNLNFKMKVQKNCNRSLILFLFHGEIQNSWNWYKTGNAVFLNLNLNKICFLLLAYSFITFWMEEDGSRGLTVHRLIPRHASWPNVQLLLLSEISLPIVQATFPSDLTYIT